NSKREPTKPCSNDFEFGQWNHKTSSCLFKSGVFLPNLVEVTPREHNDSIRLALLKLAGRNARDVKAGAVFAMFSRVVVQQVVQHRAQTKFVNHGRCPDRGAVAGDRPTGFLETAGHLLNLAGE